MSAVLNYCYLSDKSVIFCFYIRLGLGALLTKSSFLVCVGEGKIVTVLN